MTYSPPAGPEELKAGFSHMMRGSANYHGALRKGDNRMPVWVCECKPPHMSPIAARACADKELARRKRSQGVVFELLHCESCGHWFDNARVSACPACSVPMSRLKLMVLESNPA